MSHRRPRLLLLAAVAVALGLALSLLGVSLLTTPQPPTARLHFTTKDETLFAELLPLDSEEPIRPVFSIKGSSPVEVPAGSYRLRVTALGWLSDTRRLDALPGDNPPLDVPFTDSQLWQPLTLTMGGEVIGLDGRHDIMEHTPTGVRRLHGATAKPLWEARLDSSPGTPLAKAALHWSDFVPRGRDEQPRLAQTAADLDGDGRNDLLWLGRTTPALLAQSGRDGSVLWAYRAGDEREQLAHGLFAGCGSLGWKDRVRIGRVVRDPVAFDLDGKGVPVYFVTFEDDTYFWLEAIDGGTGRLRWRAALDLAWYGSAYRCERSTQAIGLNVAHLVVAVAERGGRPILSLVAVGTLVEFDARTGERLGEPLSLDRPREGKADPSLGVTFDGEPCLGAVLSSRFVDLDGDGLVELLLLRWSKRGFDVVALSLETRKPLWEMTLAESPAWWFADLDWPHVYRDDDGKTTVLVHNGSTATQCVVEALDGATGRSRWKRRLPIDPQASGDSYRLDRFLPGPDLDGDGQRELFVATLGMPHEREGKPHHWLFLDALSGTDGKTLWTTRIRQSGSMLQQQERPREVRPLAWWRTGDDGWPLLLVPIRPATGNVSESLTYVVSAGTGRVANVITNIDNPRVADLDGDGVADVYWFGRSEAGRVLDSARGTAHPSTERAPPRLDRRQPAWHEWCAETVQRYYLGIAGAVFVALTGLIAAGKRRIWLALLCVVLPLFAAGGLYLLTRGTASGEVDPRQAAEAPPWGFAMQTMALAGLLLVVFLAVWGLSRLLSRKRQ